VPVGTLVVGGSVGTLVVGGVTLEFTETESVADDSLEFELLQAAKQKTIDDKINIRFMIFFFN